MIAKEAKDKIIRILQNAKGDDTARAKIAFKNLSKKEMEFQHGYSGKSRQEILDGYLAHDKEIDDLIDIIKHS